MRSRRRTMKAKALLTALAAFVLTGCTPDWAERGRGPQALLMTAINDGAPLQSDLRISTGTVCPDFVPLRLENHYKNPLIDNTGFRGDITVERYEVRYYRSDGRDVPGVDVPYTITGNVAQEIVAPGAAE